MDAGVCVGSLSLFTVHKEKLPKPTCTLSTAFIRLVPWQTFTSSGGIVPVSVSFAQVRRRRTVVDHRILYACTVTLVDRRHFRTGRCFRKRGKVDRDRGTSNIVDPH
jgi:hypothetical protein